MYIFVPRFCLTFLIARSSRRIANNKKNNVSTRKTTKEENIRFSVRKALVSVEEGHSPKIVKAKPAAHIRLLSDDFHSTISSLSLSAEEESTVNKKFTLDRTSKDLERAIVNVYINTVTFKQVLLFPQHTFSNFFQNTLTTFNIKEKGDYTLSLWVGHSKHIDWGTKTPYEIWKNLIATVQPKNKVTKFHLHHKTTHNKTKLDVNTLGPPMEDWKCPKKSSKRPVFKRLEKKTETEKVKTQTLPSKKSKRSIPHHQSIHTVSPLYIPISGSPNNSPFRVRNIAINKNKSIDHTKEAVKFNDEIGSMSKQGGKSIPSLLRKSESIASFKLAKSIIPSRRKSMRNGNSFT